LGLRAALLCALSSVNQFQGYSGLIVVLSSDYLMWPLKQAFGRMTKQAAASSRQKMNAQEVSEAQKALEREYARLNEEKQEQIRVARAQADRQLELDEHMKALQALNEQTRQRIGKFIASDIS
jgi:ABC-type sugar transport system ATPase subunit